MSETHDGLSNQYEVSCAELDFLQQQITSHSGVMGARMMGGGFGGCVIALVHRDKKEEIVNTVKSAYQNEFGVAASDYNIALEEGTSMI